MGSIQRMLRPHEYHSPRYIETMAFVECSSLKRVVFNKSLKTIGEYAFHDYYALKSITLSDKLERIKKMAFIKCFALERVVCNKNLKTSLEPAPSSKMSSLHPARFPSVIIHSVDVLP